MSKYNFEEMKGQVVVITGAGRGIGKATAELFASYGCHVVISDVDADVCESSAAEVKKLGGDTLAIVGDITKQEDVANLMAKTVEKWGKIDCLVNNAGITKDKLFLRMTLEEWQLTVNVNLTGTFLCTKEAIKYMRKVRKGNIINLSSISRFGNPGQANYSAAKAGIAGFTKSLAKELGALNIRVNAVAPGFVDTRMTKAIPEKIAEQIKAQIALNRIGEPKEIANVILFLASQMSSYVSGCILDVNGSSRV